VLDNEVLRRIFGPRREFRSMCDGLHNLYVVFARYCCDDETKVNEIDWFLASVEKLRKCVRG
jgi:hypothetical protein